MSKAFFGILSLGLWVGGCTLSPRYVRPTAPVGGVWPGASVNSTNTGTTAHAPAADLDWAEFFQDPQLRSLILLALDNNRDLRVAALRVEQSRALYRLQRAALYPGVQGNASAVRQKFPVR